MNKSNEEKLKKTFSKILKINKSKISENLNTKNCEKWDSLAHLNIILSLESEFKISFDIDKVAKLLSYKLIKLELKKHGVK